MGIFSHLDKLIDKNYTLDPEMGGLEWSSPSRLKKIKSFIRLLEQKEKQVSSNEPLFEKIDNLKHIYEYLLAYYQTHDKKYAIELQKKLTQLDIKSINKRTNEVQPLIEQLEHVHHKLSKGPISQEEYERRRKILYGEYCNYKIDAIESIQPILKVLIMGWDSTQSIAEYISKRYVSVVFKNLGKYCSGLFDKETAPYFVDIAKYTADDNYSIYLVFEHLGKYCSKIFNKETAPYFVELAKYSPHSFSMRIEIWGEYCSKIFNKETAPYFVELAKDPQIGPYLFKNLGKYCSGLFDKGTAPYFVDIAKYTAGYYASVFKNLEEYCSKIFNKETALYFVDIAKYSKEKTNHTFRTVGKYLTKKYNLETLKYLVEMNRCWGNKFNEIFEYFVPNIYVAGFKINIDSKSKTPQLMDQIIALKLDPGLVKKLHNSLNTQGYDPGSFYDDLDKLNLSKPLLKLFISILEKGEYPNIKLIQGLLDKKLNPKSRKFLKEYNANKNIISKTNVRYFNLEIKNKVLSEELFGYNYNPNHLANELGRINFCSKFFSTKNSKGEYIINSEVNKWVELNWISKDIIQLLNLLNNSYVSSRGYDHLYRFVNYTKRTLNCILKYGHDAYIKSRINYVKGRQVIWGVSNFDEAMRFMHSNDLLLIYEYDKMKYINRENYVTKEGYSFKDALICVVRLRFTDKYDIPLEESAK